MIVNSSSMLSQIRSDFSKVYKAFSNFPESGLVWDECIKAVQDAKLINNIIFANDVLEMPPVKVFLLANKTLTQYSLSDQDKKNIGAFWGFVFKFIFLYKNQKNISVRVNTVKSATYFFDCLEPVEARND